MVYMTIVLYSHMLVYSYLVMEFCPLPQIGFLQLIPVSAGYSYTQLTQNGCLCLIGWRSRDCTNHSYQYTMAFNRCTRMMLFFVFSAVPPLV